MLFPIESHMRRVAIVLCVFLCIVFAPSLAFGADSSTVERAITWAEANPILAVALIGIIWPAITGMASLGYHRFEERFPNFIKALRASGLDVPKTARALVDMLWPKRLPPLPVLFVLCLSLVALGCNAEQLKAAQTAAEAGRDIATAAEPCFVDHRDRMLAVCADDKACQQKVNDAYKPIADAFDAFHTAWCIVSPKSEGC